MVIVNADIIMPDHMITNGFIRIENGRIQDYGEMSKAGDLAGCEILGAADINFDHAGSISGTKLTLNKACFNMMVHTGASMVEVFNYGSRNPAHAVGFCDRGEIRKGFRVDLVVVDRKLEIRTVILAGEIVKKASEI